VFRVHAARVVLLKQPSQSLVAETLFHPAM
jgi:hypothetical protein